MAPKIRVEKSGDVTSLDLRRRPGRSHYPKSPARATGRIHAELLNRADRSWALRLRTRRFSRIAGLNASGGSLRTVRADGVHNPLEVISPVAMVSGLILVSIVSSVDGAELGVKGLVDLLPIVFCECYRPYTTGLVFWHSCSFRLSSIR